MPMKSQRWHDQLDPGLQTDVSSCHACHEVVSVDLQIQKMRSLLWVDPSYMERHNSELMLSLQLQHLLERMILGHPS